MLAHVRANLLLVGLTVAIGSVLYPLAVLTVGQGVAPASASGSLVAGPGGQVVGSRLIAQGFKGDQWFHPRPSAAGYNAAASGGSNLGANNPKLRERAVAILKSRGEGRHPADAVTASGSGLDPHITLENAGGQLGRVAAAWAARTKGEAGDVRPVVEKVLEAARFRPLAGGAGGQEIVNVLEVNLELSRRLSGK